jgi:predicted O-methyltransferase YrrM
MVVIEKKEYEACDNEFTKINKLEFCNLDMYDDIGLFERLSGLIQEISIPFSIKSPIFINPTHGGVLSIITSESKILENVKLFFDEKTETSSHYTNTVKNISRHSLINISFINNGIKSLIDELCNNTTSLLFINNSKKSHILNDPDILTFNKYIASNYSNIILISERNEFLEKLYEYKYRLSNTNYTIYISKKHRFTFFINFKYYINDYGSENIDKINEIVNSTDILFKYDNLINVCIMVKNGGEQFEKMLKDNMHLIDRWTILDTGSTDNTIDIIMKILVGRKKGSLYQEPFINFRDSRNRLLELAGSSCKYTLMLDDTYVIGGNLRKFLSETRGDQFSDSFSLYIKSDDVEYGSNRVLKSNRKLKYLYTIHEVIQPDNNNNVIIPISEAFIDDRRFDYMEKRTMERKKLDLKLLYEELEDDPDNPRTHYYLAQTYNLLEDYQSAFKWFNERVNHVKEGFSQEKVDAAFEAARIANFKLNLPWDIIEPLYLKAHELDNERPDALYFIGINYYLKNDFQKAYGYFKKGFDIGYPVHRQYSLKPTLSYHFLPKFLTRTCYHINDYKLGEQSAEYFIKNNKENASDYEEVLSWYNIYKRLNTCELSKYKIKKTSSIKPIFVFVADGGFNQWSGSNILTTGVGGSETYIIEMARYIQMDGTFDVIVFCNCAENENFEGVEYKHLNEFYQFINENIVHTCIVSRFSEYLPVAFKGLAQNVYLVLHDLTPSGIVIPLDNKLKNVFCLTEWHVGYMNERFPALNKITVPFYYGIDSNKFLIKETDKITPYKFIYSSFPNRGLLPLLQIWPEIYNKYPSASLHIYADVDGTWVNNTVPEHMKEVRKLLAEYKHMNINYCGWVDKQKLANAWITADFWFYPCIFMETFCLTALEAAITKTFVVSNDLAALQNTVGNRGAVIEGDASTKEWQTKALETLFYYMDEKNSSEKQALIEKNYEWARKLTWKNQADKLLSNYIKKYDAVNIQPLSSKENKDKYNNVINSEVSDDNNIQIRLIEKNPQENRENRENQQTNIYNAYDNSNKFTYIDNIINKAYDTIQNDGLLSLANSFAQELEGSMFNEHKTNVLSNKYKDKQINLCDVLLKNNLVNVLEIGFNSGFSTLLMLMTNPNIKVTCVDICEHRYTLPCYGWISNKFPGRIEFIKGKSEDVLPKLIQQNRLYDMIHIDGGHGLSPLFHDIQNSIKMSKHNTILVMDDYEQQHIKIFWDLTIDYYKLEKYALLREIEEQSICIFKKN